MTTTALGGRIRQARKDKGFTQEQLAEALHVTRQTVSNWENDRFQPDYEMLAQIADVLSLAGLTPLHPPETQAETDAAQEIAATAAEVSVLPTRKARVLPLLLAAAVFLTGITIWLCSLRPSVANNSGYSLDWFLQEQPNEAGKAYVRLYMHEPIVKATRGTPSATPMWRFTLFLKEENGIGFTIQRADYVSFNGQEVLMVDSQTEDVLHEGVSVTRIGFNQYRYLPLSFEADDRTTGLGFALFGTDDNGQELSFHFYIPLENEYR